MFKHLFWFSKRANRAEFVFLNALFNILLLACIFLYVYSLNWLNIVPMLPCGELISHGIISLIFLVVTHILCWLSVVLILRRFYDLGWSRWWAVFLVIAGLALEFFHLNTSYLRIIFFILSTALLIVLIIKPGKDVSASSGSNDKPIYPTFMNRSRVFWTLAFCLLILEFLVVFSLYRLDIPKQAQQHFEQVNEECYIEMHGYRIPKGVLGIE